MKLIACIATLLVALIGVASSQGSQFRRTEITPKVSIELPSHWTLQGLDERRNTSASVEARIREPQHVAALSAFSQPQPSGARVRVSFLDIDETSQAEVRQEYRLRRANFLRELDETYEEMMGEMVKAGVSVTQRFRPTVVEINGMLAFKFTYERSSGDDRWLVSQHHILNGRHKVLLTISHRQRDAAIWQPILERVVNSLSVRP
jgi:hypothetical protein